MPASTFALAVGYWSQVTAETPPVLEKEGEDRTDSGTCPSVALTEPGLGGSSSKVLKGTQLQTGRYFNDFPASFSSYKTSSAPDCY